MILIANNDLILTFVKDRIFLYDCILKSHESVTIPEPVLPSDLTKDQREAILTDDRNIISGAVSSDQKFIAVCTTNKQLVLYDNKLQLIQSRLTSRAPTKLCFSPSNDLVVADKTGEVHLYKLHSLDEPPKLLLGHVSIVLDVAVSECGKYIATCDRDEKIRVSRFPNSYNIASYCLGHSEFVTNVKFHDCFLVSSSGDGTIRIWDAPSGTQLHEIRSILEKDQFEHGARAIRDAVGTENVQVSALPIINMQIFSRDNKVFIVTSVLNSNGLQVYRAEREEMSGNFTTKLLANMCMDNERLFAFSQGKEFYYVTDKGFYKCIFEGDEIRPSFCDSMNRLFQDIVSVGVTPIPKAEDIYVLYKRKYNNVSEYLERKKARLENHR